MVFEKRPGFLAQALRQPHKVLRDAKHRGESHTCGNVLRNTSLSRQTTGAKQSIPRHATNKMCGTCAHKLVLYALTQLFTRSQTCCSNIITWAS